MKTYYYVLKGCSVYKIAKNKTIYEGECILANIQDKCFENFKKAKTYFDNLKLKAEEKGKRIYVDNKILISYKSNTPDDFDIKNSHYIVGQDAELPTKYKIYRECGVK